MSRGHWQSATIARRILVVAIVVFVVATSTVFAAAASVMSVRQDVAGGLTVSLAEMGLGGRQSFAVPTDASNLLIPVPDGLVPIALIGAVTVPTGAARVEFEVSAA